MRSFNSVAIIGAGAWGTALAGVAARAGRDVTLYARSSMSTAQIKATRENPKLPGVQLSSAIAVTNDMGLAAAADFLLLTSPAQCLRDAVTAWGRAFGKGNPVTARAKAVGAVSHHF